ncbi:MAG: MBL fold metallo-hydrolase [Flavobacterium sp.]|nr:MAG: MBL fold metallo-hydrolase [Flavobacterium sp.]
MKLYIALAILVILVIATIWILNLPVFGKHPAGKRLEKLQSLSNYKNGQIENLSPTPNLPEGVSYWNIISKMIEGNDKGSPTKAIPHLKSDFTSSDELKITWFGHSSYLLQVDGINILVDPVFSERTSPFQWLGTKQFLGTDFITPEELPDLDIVIITHDHYDHLDYNTILKLKDRTKHFITSLGVGEHLEYWGIDASKITELTWNESTTLPTGASITATPARHFSGRGFTRNKALWSSFVLKTKNNNIYIGGDSGYDTHFKNIGETYGPFDVAILECGQYNLMWPLIHMMPEQVVQANLDLNAKKLLPVHWAKFKLALHDWDEPIKKVIATAEKHNVSILTPIPGQTFKLDDGTTSKKWWIELAD